MLHRQFLHLVCPRPVSATAAEGLLLFSDLTDAISIHALCLLAQADDAAPAAPTGIGAILNNPLFPLVGLFVLFYVLLVFTWQITGILTAITGIIDNWLDFRKKPENRDNVN